MATIALGMGAVVIALIIGGSGTVGFFDIWFKVSDLTLGGRTLVGALGVATLGIMLKCFYHLHRLLTNYSRAEIFTGESAAQIRQMGICCTLCGGAEILWPFVARLVLAHPASRVTGHGTDLIIGGLIVIALSWFMAIASEMKEENELTV